MGSNKKKLIVSGSDTGGKNMSYFQDIFKKCMQTYANMLYYTFAPIGRISAMSHGDVTMSEKTASYVFCMLQNWNVSAYSFVIFWSH